MNFMEINNKIKGDVSYIKIFGDEIIINIGNSKETVGLKIEN